MATEDPILSSVADATPKLVQLLTPLTPEGRQRAIASALMVFGESVPTGHRQTEIKPGSSSNPPVSENGFSHKALAWMEKNMLARGEIEHVFLVDETSVEVIASKMPEKTVAKQATQAYLLCGLGSFLKTGELTFTDEAARALCEKVGAYDSPNHAKSRGDLATYLAAQRKGVGNSQTPA
jgi:hypothetical protein